MDHSFELFECQNLFNEALKNGLNLFCGAGFSIESEDYDGKKLPVGNELLNELKQKFPDINAYYNLPRACTKLSQTNKEGFYSFLKKRFSVSSFNTLYSELLEINLKNIYSTNIDDLFFKIFEGSKNLKYLNDKSKKGDPFNDNLAVNYIPLHGCVRYNDHYVFGATEIASAFSDRTNEKGWKILAKDASSNPILFWGWNFEDAGPIEAMYGPGNDLGNNINRWVLLYQPTEEIIDFLHSLKFNIIISDTIQMLNYIANYTKSIIHVEKKQLQTSINKQEDVFFQYHPPKNDKNLPSYPLKSLFMDYTPRWSHIYSHSIPKTINYKKVADGILSNKNIMVIGMRGSGKTTLLMQLLADLDLNKPKHYIVAPSLEQAKNYLKVINGSRSLLFVDDCFRDTYAVLELFKASNVQVVLFDRDFNYERQFHHLNTKNFKKIDITEIIKEDAQSIINSIPIELRKSNKGTEHFEKDPTILNVLATNLRAVNFNFMKAFHKKDSIAAETFLMICYVHSCGVPCSFDMIYSFLGDDKYNLEQMLDIVRRAGGLIRDCDEGWCKYYNYNIDYSIQDYYQCRSRFFAESIILSIPRGNEVFANILLDFAQYVPIYKICHYDKFRRGGYDADFAIRAFPKIEDGEEYYNICADKDDSEYIYQQAALYFSRNRDYKKAFEWIDKARNLAHYNRFSIDSTFAKIYFDVNINTDRAQALKALEILSNCCTRDKRKSIHFLTFSKCVLQFHEKYHDDDSFEYIKVALTHVNEGLADDNLSLSRKNRLALRSEKEKLLKFIEEWKNKI